MEVKYSCPERSRRDFLAMREESPIRNFRCGWFSLPGKEEELSMCFTGQGIHRLFHMLCLAVPNEGGLFCAFSVCIL